MEKFLEAEKLLGKDCLMKMYYRISPILMTVGFVILAAGVFLSMSYWQRLAYILVGFGLILYIVGRIGIHFAKNNTPEIESGKDKKEDTEEIQNGKNKIEI